MVCVLVLVKITIIATIIIKECQVIRFSYNQCHWKGDEFSKEKKKKNFGTWTSASTSELELTVYSYTLTLPAPCKVYHFFALSEMPLPSQHSLPHFSWLQTLEKIFEVHNK